jgi:hypothetical protein
LKQGKAGKRKGAGKEILEIVKVIKIRKGTLKIRVGSMKGDPALGIEKRWKGDPAS